MAGRWPVVHGRLITHSDSHEDALRSRAILQRSKCVQRKMTAPQTEVSARPAAEIKSPEVIELLSKVEQALREGQPAAALEAINRARVKSPWVTNAAGVCQLRLGNMKLALEVFRG